MVAFASDPGRITFRDDHSRTPGRFRLNFFFLDSSSFAKLYVQETGSESLRRELHSVRSNQQAVCSLVRVEIQSALTRRLRQGEMSAADVFTAEQSFLTSYAELIHWDIDDALLTAAMRLLRLHDLRSLDALQLAAALSFRDFVLPGDRFLFVASDRRLLRAAMAEGLSTWDPAVASFPPPVN